MHCTRCDGIGFINLHQIPSDILDDAYKSEDFHQFILDWIKLQVEPHDVSVCDCCGNGDEWYNTPGEHFTGEDVSECYGYNGGLPECN